MIITATRLKKYCEKRIAELLQEADGKPASAQIAATAATGELTRLVHALDEKAANLKKRNN